MAGLFLYQHQVGKSGGVLFTKCCSNDSRRVTVADRAAPEDEQPKSDVRGEGMLALCAFLKCECHGDRLFEAI